MAFDLHTVSVGMGNAPTKFDRLTVGLFQDQPFPASAASVTTLGSITAGTGFDVLPAVAPTGGTLTAGVSPADPAVAVATSLKCVTATVLAPGTGVAVNDTFNPAGGTLQVAGPYGNNTTTVPVATKLTATHVQVISAAVLAGGTGGTPGAVTITGTTGTGTKFQATGTISAGGALTGALTITVAGDYTVQPTNAGDAVTGGSLSGATVTLVTGALTFAITTAGGYVVAPSATLTDVVGTGVGVTATLAYGLGTAAILHSGNYSGAPSFTVTAADGNGTGASIATATLGASGGPIVRQVVTDMPASYVLHGSLSSAEIGTFSVINKSNLGFSWAVVPTTTVAAGTADILLVA